jgi:phosphoribosylaminoimidazole carboxylase (NCAIR synthetase)
MAAPVGLRSLASVPKGVRRLHLHHHQSVALLAKANVPTTRLELVNSEQDAADAFSRLSKDSKAILRAELTGADGRRSLYGGAFEEGTSGFCWTVDSSASLSFLCKLLLFL